MIGVIDGVIDFNTGKSGSTAGAATAGGVIDEFTGGNGGFVWAWLRMRQLYKKKIKLMTFNVSSAVSLLN